VKVKLVKLLLEQQNILDKVFFWPKQPDIVAKNLAEDLLTSLGQRVWAKFIIDLPRHVGQVLQGKH
jgi:hypothetical protein